LTPRRIWMVLLIVATLSAPAEPKAASVYSMVLVGEAIESGDVRAISLGGSTQLFVDSLGAVQLNPALLARIPRVTIGATQYLAMDQGRSDAYRETDVSFTFSSFRAVFPVTGLFRFAIGYTGRYEPEGSFSLRDATDGGDEFTQTYKKSGGLFSIPLTAAFDVTRYASVGLTFSFERGTIEERWDVVFDELSFVPGAGLKKKDLSGTGFGGGVVLYPASGVTIGGMYESAIDYDAEVYEKYTQVSLDTSYSSTLSLPARVSAGATWRFGDTFMVLASGAWRDYVERLKGIYRSRRDAMVASLGDEFPEGSRWTVPQGGFFVWATLPPPLDTGDLLVKALEENVAFVRGDGFYMDGQGRDSMRLSFSAIPEERIQEGVRRLGGVIEDQIGLYRALGL